ncbi:S16 family serine protease [Psychrobacillus sp. FJAT-21963]|uniref:S16 family serine protease n=1 Tax=Psychrobacillus sp. FJAT-21963 TaxID=1712028 RepID=UPI0006F98193|nr:S16 family serine protease [Psychrobacillus sp. FJAT-21963]KQL34417.1 hypothetical protein AN959_15590 [Psychrobacillus sp. FJAT-21963]
MSIDHKKTHPNFPFIAMILVYFTELYLYLINVITGFFFVNVLLAMTVLIALFTLSVRKLTIPKPPFVFSIITSLLLMIYEMPLILVDNHQYLVTSPAAPEELIKGSGIFLIAVNETILGSVDSEQVLESYVNSNAEFFEIKSIKNHERYSSKNIAIVETMGIQKDEFEQMAENVRTYLNTSNDSIDEFLSRDGSGGNSAGLALALSSLSKQGEYKNDLQFGVTGAINDSGEVKEIGLVKEKVWIANENGLPYIILPLGNLSEAKDVKKVLSLKIDLIGVHDVGEAVQIIEELNNK